MDGLIRAHLGVEPDHILLGNRGIYALTDSDEVALTGPDPEARGDAAKGKGTNGQTNKLESGKSDTVEKFVLSIIGRVGSGRESSKGVEGATDDIGHERRDATSDNRSEEGREDEGEEVAAGEEGKEERDGGLWGRAYRGRGRRLDLARRSLFGEVGGRCGWGGHASR